MILSLGIIRKIAYALVEYDNKVWGIRTRVSLTHLLSLKEVDKYRTYRWSFEDTDVELESVRVTVNKLNVSL